MTIPQNRPGRNHPCPCGSGRKFKNCCIGKSPGSPAKWYTRTTPIVLLTAVVGVLAIVLFAIPGERREENPPASQQSGTDPAAPSAGGWEYDAVNDRHWDPNHGHWHDGPPPPSQTGLPRRSGSPAAPAGSGQSQSEQPAPWQYDEGNNRHWNPNHGHWHEGRPPSQTGQTAAPE
jgi:hypothetical protein